MAWYDRHASDLERLEFSRLAELYSLLKRWKESVPELPWRPIQEFEMKKTNPDYTLDDLLNEETGEEMIATLKAALRKLLVEWEPVFAGLREKRSPLLSRALRLAEEEALRYSSAQWKDRSEDRFPTLGPVFAAYRETPFYTLYRDQLVIIRQTESELLFFTSHPVLDLESSWMRGFVSALRPSVSRRTVRLWRAHRFRLERDPGVSRARKELQLLQRSIYASLQKEAASLLGRTPIGIRKYEKTYQRELERLEKKAKPTTMAKLVARARNADVLLIGDYHTYGQSQRAVLRLLRELATKIPPRDMVLGMECISTHHQLHLDQWLRGQISEDQFLRAVQYDEAWGFPWENYRGLFHFARDHGMEILALNRPRELLPPLAAISIAKRAGDLGARDEWAAGIVVDELLRPRARKVIAVYGEYHLSPSHLPSAIREVARRNGLTPPELLVLHQNRDELFWKLAAKGLEQQTSLVALEGDHLCVFSGTPWTKLQSLVNWIRGDLTRFVDEDEGDAEEEFLQWMRIYGNGVSRFFHIPDAGYGTLHLARWEDLQGGPRWWRRLLQSQERFYLREDESSVLVYVSSFSENAAAEVASVHLLHHDNPRKRAFRGVKDMASDDFAANALDHAFGFLGSLLINPRRKCDFPVDHEARLRELRRNPKSALFVHESASRKLFVALAKRRRFERPAVEKILAPNPPEVLFTGSRFLGHWLGARLHESLLKGERTPEQIRLFFYERRRADAWLRLEELFADFGGKPRKKRSKRDSL